LKSREMSRHTATPRTLLPRVEGRREDADAELAGQHGEDAAATPLLAGMPTEYTHSPAKSYMPQVVITLSTLCTSSLADGALAGERVDAAVGQGRRHHRSGRGR
jgi:hypothetical protein